MGGIKKHFVFTIRVKLPVQPVNFIHYQEITRTETWAEVTKKAQLEGGGLLVVTNQNFFCGGQNSGLDDARAAMLGLRYIITLRRNSTRNYPLG